jgi:hypothetical protein
MRPGQFQASVVRGHVSFEKPMVWCIGVSKLGIGSWFVTVDVVVDGQLQSPQWLLSVPREVRCAERHRELSGHSGAEW